MNLSSNLKNMSKILLVEDEKNFGIILKDYLVISGFDVVLCDDGEIGLHTFIDGKFDLCILDIMLPKKDGFTLASDIKQINPQTPILFLTAKALREDVIKGYKLGAFDYITKPFDLEVLLYKIKAILNQNSKIQDSNYIFELNNYSLNTKLRRLTHNNEIIKLTPKETLLLKLLIQHKNQVLLRSEALKAIWKEDNYFTARSMDVYIVKLRKYFLKEERIKIINVHGDGYSLQVA